MGTRKSSAKVLRKPYANYMICMAGALKSVPFNPYPFIPYPFLPAP